MSPAPRSTLRSDMFGVQVTTDLTGEKTLTRWERIGVETRWGRYLSAVERRMLLRAIEASPGPPVALEVGCEGGRWTELLANAGWCVTSTDIDRESLDVCEHRVPSAKCLLVEPNATMLPAESGSLGLLLCYEVFTVVHERWFLDEVARVLAPGGVFVAVVSNRSSHRRFLWEAANRGRPEEDINGLPMYSRTYGSWRQQLRDNGFVTVAEEGFCWMPFSRQSDSHLVEPLNKVERILNLQHLPTLSPWVCAVMAKDLHVTSVK